MDVKVRHGRTTPAHRKLKLSNHMETPTHTAPPVDLDLLVRLLEAVRKAKPWIKSFENMLASSLSSDARSHDDDRQPRRDITAVLNALAECDKPNDQALPQAGRNKS